MKAQPEDCLPNQRGFEQFLAWLDEGTDSGGEKYLEIRRRLVFYFQRKACARPDELADETLSRVARRLAEESGIREMAPCRYCYIIAKFVLLEHVRGVERRQVSLDGLSNPDQFSSSMTSPALSYQRGDLKEKMDRCLEECLQRLAPENRELIYSYYQSEGRAKVRHRRNLATKLNVTLNALSIKACRIRATLEACVRTCSENE